MGKKQTEIVKTKLLSLKYNTMIMFFIELYKLSILTMPNEQIEIHKGEFDQNKYQGKILKNGIKAIVVTNKNAKKSAFTISIKAGSLNDTLPGISRLVAQLHLIHVSNGFIREDILDKIEKNKGNIQYDTNADFTTFSFAVKPKYFIKTLKLFRKLMDNFKLDFEMMHKSISKIYKHFEENKFCSYHRFDRIISTFCKKEYDYFTLGNYYSLSKDQTSKCKLIEPIQEKAMDFKNKNYNSYDITVAILHNKNEINEVEKTFETLSNSKDTIKTR